MDSRTYKIVAGLALENELYNRRFNKTLLDIYSNPRFEVIKTLHDQLINSDDHLDREAAFWLEMALQQPPLRINLQDLIVEMREMEVLLSSLLLQVDAESQRDINDWTNYIINTAQSLQDGYGIDAKILISSAVQTSRKESVERIKRNPTLLHETDVLQKATIRLFEEIKSIPLKLTIPEEHLDIVIELQAIIIDLLQRRYSEHLDKENENLIVYTLKRLEASLRYLMQSDRNKDKVKQEILLACEHLDLHTNNSNENLVWTRSIHERIEKLLTFFGLSFACAGL